MAAAPQDIDYRSLFDLSVENLVLLELGADDEATQVVAVSDAACAALGFERGELLAMAPQVVSADDSEARRRLPELLAGETVRFDTKLLDRDGRPILVDVIARRLELGGRAYLLASARDIRERAAAEAELRRSREQLARCEELAAVGSARWDMRSGRHNWSEQFSRLLGVEPGELEPSADSFVAFVHGGDLAAAQAGFDHALSKARPVEGDLRIVRRDGEERVLFTKLTMEHDADGVVAAMFVTARDVTEERRAAAELEASRERLQRGRAFVLRAQEIARVGAWGVDLDTQLVEWSDEHYRMCGLEPGDWDCTVASFLNDVCHPDDRAMGEKVWQEMIETHETREFEYRVVWPDGTVRLLLSRGEAVEDVTGRAVAIVGASQDVTDLRAGQEQLRLLAETVSKTAEQERRRLGAELHDRTVQTLGLMRVKMSELRASLAGPESGALAGEIMELLESAIVETRSLLQELGPPILYELGFEPAVEWLAERAQQQFGFECRVTCSAETSWLHDDAAAVLFQAVRELLTNVGKHAGARSASVSIAIQDGQLVVCVEDDGVGFACDSVPPSPSDRGNFGLFSIRERLRVLGGELCVAQQGGRGARIVLRVPTGVGIVRNAAWKHA